MKFVLEVQLDPAAPDGKTAQELGRILRYWGGNLTGIELVPGAGFPVYDSAYNEVGAWRIVDDE